MLSKVESTCYKCTRREVGCHSKCEEYIAFRKSKDKENEEEYKRKIKNRMINDDRIARLKSMTKNFKK